jgi:type IV secretory pathway ATPase VirB11/archaellum biosynthesis ATPase
MQRLEEHAKFLTAKKEQMLIREAREQIVTALVQLRSKEIGSQTPIARITYPVKSGSVREANQLNEEMP